VRPRRGILSAQKPAPAPPVQIRARVTADDVAVAGDIHAIAVGFERDDRVLRLFRLHVQNDDGVAVTAVVIYAAS
jgi:hypothetical protein